MTVSRGVRLPGARQIRGERIIDEVYRQMFLLEEKRPGSEIGLALVLLQAWLDADAKPADDEEREWLKKVSPICLKMIETSLQAGGSARASVPAEKSMGKSSSGSSIGVRLLPTLGCLGLLGLGVLCNKLAR